MLTTQLVESCRAQFPALAREVGGQPAVFFDGPAGTQVPTRVADAVRDYLLSCNANHGGRFATAEESDRMLTAAHRAVADLVGTDDPETVSFGPNMTTLTFALSRALSRTWKRGDEVVVTRLDHDANVTPWVLAAGDAGAIVRYVDIHLDDCTLNLESLQDCLSDRTKLVAVGCASNAVGSINPVREITRWAHDAGALVFLDAVHYAPHALIDVAAFGCDFLACSAYKFFGPHIGIQWGRRDLLEELAAYKVRPAANTLPDKWMTGTQSHEGIAGTLEAVDYLADLGRSMDASVPDRRSALSTAYTAIGAYERQLIGQLIDGLTSLDSVCFYGITDRHQFDWRMPTVSITHDKLAPDELAERLGERGIFTWHGNYYALQLSETLGMEPDGMLRIGLVHYNTPSEIDRLLNVLSELD